MSNKIKVIRSIRVNGYIIALTYDLVTHLYSRRVKGNGENLKLDYKNRKEAEARYKFDVETLSQTLA